MVDNMIRKKKNNLEKKSRTTLKSFHEDIISWWPFTYSSQSRSIQSNFFNKQIHCPHIEPHNSKYNFWANQKPIYKAKKNLKYMIVTTVIRIILVKPKENNAELFLTDTFVFTIQGRAKVGTIRYTVNCFHWVYLTSCLKWKQLFGSYK